MKFLLKFANCDDPVASSLVRIFPTIIVADTKAIVENDVSPIVTIVPI